MFKDNYAFSGFSVDDLAKAKDFYGGMLGLDVADGEMGTLEVTLGTGAKVFVYEKPNHTPATFTVLNFVTQELEETVDDLIAAGVRMEHYDMPEIKTDEKGIARDGFGPPIAWFTDPAGNILSVLEGGPD